ncbi:hypothetical protein E2320_015292, partial [Naja naja]
EYSPRLTEGHKWILAELAHEFALEAFATSPRSRSKSFNNRRPVGIKWRRRTLSHGRSRQIPTHEGHLPIRFNEEASSAVFSQSCFSHESNNSTPPRSLSLGNVVQFPFKPATLTEPPELPLPSAIAIIGATDALASNRRGLKRGKRVALFPSSVSRAATMPKAKQKQRRKKYNYNVDRKKLNRAFRKRSAPKIKCAQIRHAWDSTKSVSKNLAEMGLAVDPNKAIPIPKNWNMKPASQS